MKIWTTLTAPGERAVKADGEYIGLITREAEGWMWTGNRKAYPTFRLAAEALAERKLGTNSRPFAKVHVAKTLSGQTFHLAKHGTRETLCGRFLDDAAPVTENYPGKTISDVGCGRCRKSLDAMIETGEV